MKSSMRTKSCVLASLAIFSASVAAAAPITLPSSLAPGSTYFLAFVTAGTRDATSTEIGDYDTFVTTRANMDPALAALGTTWRVIGSTAEVDAVTHIAVTGPVYNLNGELVATGSADLFDGSLTNPIDYTEFGDLGITRVWTGSDVSGLPDGSFALGAGAVRFGLSENTNTSWSSLEIALNFNTRSLYGVSGPLVVPTTTVPEPSTLSLMLGPLLLGVHRRWRGRQATRSTRSAPAYH